MTAFGKGMRKKMNDAQLDFPVLYASGRNGWAVKELSDEKKDLTPLFELILSYDDY